MYRTRACISTHNPIKNNTVCAALSLDHVVLGLQEARLYSSGPLLRCIVHIAMKRLTYNNHTDIQDELRNARLSYMYTHDCRVYVHVRPERYAAVNPPLRHGREVTRVNEKRGYARLLVSLSLSLSLSPSLPFSLLPRMHRVLARNGSKSRLNVRLLAYLEWIL